MPANDAAEIAAVAPVLETLDLRAPVRAARIGLPDEVEITDRLMLDLHDAHPGLLFEVAPRRELLITCRIGGGSSEIAGDLMAQTWLWSGDPAIGITRDGSGGYEPIPGVRFEPDGSWVGNDRAKVLPPRDQRPLYWPIAPEFVIEVQSPSDRRSQQEEKLEHWIQLGVSVGLLVDPFQQQVLIYRPDAEPETRNRPDRLEIGPELPGLALDFTRIWAG